MINKRTLPFEKKKLMKIFNLILIIFFALSALIHANESIISQSDEDYKKYMSFEKHNPIKLKEHYKFVDKLSKERKIELARNLLDNEITLIAYHGCFILISEGLESETIPTLAEIIASGKAHRDLNDRLGWDWYHYFNDSAIFHRMILNIAEFLFKNIDKYQGERQKNVISFFKLYFQCEEIFTKKIIKSKIKEYKKALKLQKKKSSAQ